MLAHADRQSSASVNYSSNTAQTAQGRRGSVYMMDSLLNIINV